MDWSTFTSGQDGAFAELKSAVENGLSEAGLMLLVRPDHGAVTREENSSQCMQPLDSEQPVRLEMTACKKHTVPTQFVKPGVEKCAYRRFGRKVSWVRNAELSRFMQAMVPNFGLLEAGWFRATRMPLGMQDRLQTGMGRKRISSR